MDLSPLRCLAGGALAAATFLTGCGGSPLTPDDSTLLHADSDGGFRPIRAEPAVGERADREGGTLPVLDEEATLEDYLRYAALNNPGLEAQFNAWKAAVERVPQVRALPDPRFTYGYYIGEVETRVGPMQHSLALSQRFPWFGKLQDREDAAARNAAAAFHRFEAAQLELFVRVERAYNELYYLKRSIDITSDNIELVQQIERVVRARYRVAAASHPDLIKVQVELAKLEDRLRQLRDLEAPRRAQLNAALNRTSDASLPWPTTVDDRINEREFSDLLEELRQRNPDLHALEEEIERERINAEIAREDGLPDFTLGLAWTLVGDRDDVSIPENGDDAVLGTLSINIPLWRDKYEAGVREALARRLAVANRRLERVNRLTADLQQALFDHRDGRRRIELYDETLIPKAVESFEASLAAFEQGEADFLDLLDTERTLLEFQLALERARVDQATARARIEQLIGVGLSESGSTPSPEEANP
jgi:cobalt-zinc-cadmium efflux system outer membrane protein